ncbi:NAD-dependent epimerase/dehydratase family protein [Tenacibaculum maritimum]|uniref:NAD-dependent epimerase/dehydratase family protein n=1 Tax=Tenacibaculum maritimum TaxID=107401 RepID=UPI0012E48D14|nr:NAD-dependent epimerase/dehydratase family protein [Tenacibaculum maritimum]CAA0209668.1 NAD-dependent epimerase family protein [Tenacibaculum maritimum]
MILVTGGTGLVGSHLLYYLTEANHRIRAIYRTEEKIEKVKKVFSFYTDDVLGRFNKIEWVRADITELPSLIPVFEEVIQVYHCAALVSFDPKDYRKMRQVNIEGTANVVNLCIDKGIQKICFVSSIAAVGDSIEGKLITEENEWIETGENHGYAITKYGAEMEVWRGSQEGVDVVIVNPGVILGSGFWEEGSGKLFAQVYNGLRFYTEGVTGFIGVQDVVKVMISLMKSSSKNERFILVSENKSFRNILFLMADFFQKKRAFIKVGKLVTSIVWRMDWLLTIITGKKPFLVKNTAKSSHNVSYYSSAKIKGRLDIEFTPIHKVVQEVCENYLN